MKSKTYKINKYKEFDQDQTNMKWKLFLKLQRTLKGLNNFLQMPNLNAVSFSLNSMKAMAKLAIYLQYIVYLLKKLVLLLKLPIMIYQVD